MDAESLKPLDLNHKEELINELINTYGQDLLKLVYSYVNSQEVAEDLTQDIFIKCYKTLDTFKGRSSIKTWLWRIAINQCKDYLKSWHKRNVFPSENQTVFDQVDHEHVEHHVIQKDTDVALVRAVMKLPIKYREVVYLHYYEDLPIKEISAVINKNQNTIKTRLKRAKELLRKELERANGK